MHAHTKLLILFLIQRPCLLRLVDLPTAATVYPLSLLWSAVITVTVIQKSLLVQKPPPASDDNDNIALNHGEFNVTYCTLLTLDDLAAVQKSSGN